MDNIATETMTVLEKLEQETMTVLEAAHRLGITLTTAYKWQDARCIPYDRQPQESLVHNQGYL